MKNSKPSTVFVCALAFVYNVINGQIQSRYLARYGDFEEEWFVSPVFGPLPASPPCPKHDKD
eukprot:1631599-Rhodomonas_salina.1